MKSIQIRWKPITVLLIGIICIGSVIPVSAIAGGHGDTGKLKYVVSEEGKTGISLILAKLYNNNRLLYALVVTFTMAFLGMIVAQVTELILKTVGVR